MSHVAREELLHWQVLPRHLPNLYEKIETSFLLFSLMLTITLLKKNKYETNTELRLCNGILSSFIVSLTLVGFNSKPVKVMAMGGQGSPEACQCSEALAPTWSTLG